MLFERKALINILTLTPDRLKTLKDTVLEYIMIFLGSSGVVFDQLNLA